jgi:hypothetical protein
MCKKKASAEEQMLLNIIRYEKLLENIERIRKIV